MSNKKDPEKSIVEGTPLPKKRGRKSKKDIELALQQQQINLTTNSSINTETNININNSIVTTNMSSNMSSNTISNTTSNNINVLIEDTCEIANDLNILQDNNETDENIIEKNIFLSENSNEEKPVKKRGRKPKGGKIIQQMVQLNNDKQVKPNVILHLKCCLKDLHTNTLTTDDFDSFNFSSTITASGAFSTNPELDNFFSILSTSSLSFLISFVNLSNSCA